MRALVVVPCVLLLSSCASLAAPQGAPDGRSVRSMLAAQIRDPAAGASASSAEGLDGRAAMRAQAAYEKSFGEHQSTGPLLETAK